MQRCTVDAKSQNKLFFLIIPKNMYEQMHHKHLKDRVISETDCFRLYLNIPILFITIN